MSVITYKSKEITQRISLFGYLSIILGCFLIGKNLFSINSLMFFLFTYASWRALQRYSYAFWTLVFISFFFLIFSIIEINPGAFQLIALIIVSMLYLGISYSFFNPIFYPIINWLEYDFRYRHDVPFFLCLKNGCFESRLMDFKLQRSSFHSFEDLDIGEKVEMFYQFKDNQVLTSATVLSIRQNTLGRGYYYGVEFDKSESVEILGSYWRAQKTHKKKLKKINNGK